MVRNRSITTIIVKMRVKNKLSNLRTSDVLKGIRRPDIETLIKRFPRSATFPTRLNPPPVGHPLLQRGNHHFPFSLS